MIINISDTEGQLQLKYFVLFEHYQSCFMILLHHWIIEIKRKHLLNSETKVLFRLVYKFDLRLVSNIKELTSQDPLTCHQVTLLSKIIINKNKIKIIKIKT